MAGWFNIQQLKDPTAIQAVANGAGALGTALGAVTDKLGSIYNAERDRKYKMEQDAKNYELQKAKNDIDIQNTAAQMLGRNAQAKMYDAHARLYDTQGANDTLRANSYAHKNYSDATSNRMRAHNDGAYKQGMLNLKGQEISQKGNGSAGGGAKFSSLTEEEAKQLDLHEGNSFKLGNGRIGVYFGDNGVAQDLTPKQLSELIQLQERLSLLAEQNQK